MTNGNLLKDRMKDSRDNNFDFLRFTAASLVVFSHSFALSYSRFNQQEPLSLLSNNQETMGGLAVAIFFIISGFLITMSYKNTPSNVEFIIKRSLRIFPGLIVVVLLSAFLLGPLLSSYVLSDYFSNQSTYAYLGNVSLWKMQWELPGVFSNNPYPGAVNGSLWTLYYEFACYLIILALGAIGMLSWQTMLLFVIFCASSILVDWHALPFLWRINDYFLPMKEYKDYLTFFAYFFSGSLLYLLRNRVPLTGKLALLSMVVMIIAIVLGGFKLAIVLAGSYLVIYFSHAAWLPMSNFTKHGDFSYGIYVYAFPIQQTVTYLIGPRADWLLNFSLSYPAIVLCSAASWHWVERPALQAKKRIHARFVAHANWLAKRVRQPR